MKLLCTELSMHKLFWERQVFLWGFTKEHDFDISASFPLQNQLEEVHQHATELQDKMHEPTMAGMQNSQLMPLFRIRLGIGKEGFSSIDSINNWAQFISKYQFPNYVVPGLVASPS